MEDYKIVVKVCMLAHHKRMLSPFQSQEDRKYMVFMDAIMGYPVDRFKKTTSILIFTKFFPITLLEISFSWHNNMCVSINDVNKI